MSYGLITGFLHSGSLLITHGSLLVVGYVVKIFLLICKLVFEMYAHSAAEESGIALLEYVEQGAVCEHIVALSILEIAGVELEQIAQHGL